MTEKPLYAWYSLKLLIIDLLYAYFFEKSNKIQHMIRIAKIENVVPISSLTKFQLVGSYDI